MQTSAGFLNKDSNKHGGAARARGRVRGLIGRGLAAAIVLAASVGAAGPKDFAVYSTRLGGDAAQAQPYVDKLSQYLETTLSWPAKTVKGTFAPSKKEATAAVDQGKPGFGFVEPTLYFELQKPQKLTVLAAVDSAELNTPKLNVVVKDPAYKSLADLKGKKVWTTLADYPRYLGNVVLDGKGPADKMFELKQIGAVTKGARAVLRGEADATLLDDAQLAEMKKLEGGDALRSIHSSGPLPPLLVVAFGTALTDAERKNLTKALLEMCGTPKGGEVCKDMRITKFVPADTKLLQAAQAKFDKP